MLKKNIVKALIFTNIGEFTNRFIQTITKIILARLLLPADFGIVALALVFINFLNLINGLGIDSALIQKKEKFRRLIGSAFILLSGMGAFFFIGVFLSASLISSFYHTPAIKVVIKVLAILLIIQPLKMIPSAFLNINLKFPKLILSEIITNLVFLFITSFLALVGISYWALVIGSIISNIVHMLSLWMLIPYTPFSLKLNFSDIKELIEYGRYISSAAIISFFITQGDGMLVGKLLGLGALGFYTMAFAVSDLTFANFSHALSRVIFPIYAHLKNDIRGLTKAYSKNLQFISFLILPLVLALFIFGKNVILLVLGQKWMPMLLVMQIFCFHGFFRSMHISASIFLIGTGEARLNQNILLLELCILVIFIFPLIYLLGITGAAIAILIARFFAFILSTKFVLKRINMSPLMMFYLMFPQSLFCLFSGLIIAFLNFLIPAESVIILILYMVIYFLIYLILSLLGNRMILLELRLFLSPLFKSLITFRIF